MEDHYLIKVNQNGDEEWNRIFDGGGYGDVLYSIIQTPDGGFVMSGGSSFIQFSQPRGCMYILHTDNRGESLWEIKEGGVPHAELLNSKIIRTEDNGYIVLAPSMLGSDIWVVKTGEDPVSVPDQKNAPVPKNFTFLQSYPNPFNSTTTIKYSLPFPTHVSLGVYDPLGRQIGTLCEGYKQVGIHTTNLNATDLPSGLYFIRLESSGQVQLRKIILLK